MHFSIQSIQSIQSSRGLSTDTHFGTDKVRPYLPISPPSRPQNAREPIASAVSASQDPGCVSLLSWLEIDLLFSCSIFDVTIVGIFALSHDIFERTLLNVHFQSTCRKTETKFDSAPGRKRASSQSQPAIGGPTVCCSWR